jgi:hypothetical protein
MTFSHPKCYASSLGGCSSKISLEHYFSHSLYKLLAKGDPLHVEGMPWLPADGSAKIPAKSLGSNILCENHNSALSKYDDEALKMFNHLRYESKSNNPIFIKSDIERWYLKALIGCVIANKTAGGKKWNPPIDWLRVLFKDKNFTKGAGLHIPISGKKLKGVYNGVDFQVSYRDPTRNKPIGIFIRFGWMASYFTMEAGIGPREWNYSFRPKYISVQYPDKKKIIEFPWNGITAGFTGPIPNDPT